MKKYDVFKFDSRNTGYIIEQGLTIAMARKVAKRFNHAQVQGDNGYFEDYENGEKVSWSA